METYKKDQEYTLKVVNTDNEIKEIKYTPNKDMSKPEMIMALKSKYKNFFKLLENKTIKTEKVEVDWFEYRDYNDFRSDIIQGQLRDGRQFLAGDYDSVQVYKKGYNAIQKLNDKLKTDDENVLEQIDIDMANNEDDITNEEANTINNQIFNKKTESKEIEQHRNKKLEELQSNIRYNFEEAYKDWGKEVSDTKAGFVDEYMSEYCNDYGDEIDWKDYIVAIPELDKIYVEYKDVENWEIPDDIKWEQYELITDYVQNYLKGVYSKEEKTSITEVKNDNSVIVVSYGRGMRFPDRETAIEYYKECIAGTDPDGAENYAYQNILDMLVSTDEPVVYDWDDRTEYDWWVQKGKPTDDISDELLKAHLGENKRMKKEDLSDKDMKELDEYTDNEIKKMYDKYCSENKNKKSFEDWQKENVDSALVNELEYEFFSNRKKTEDLEVEEKVYEDGFVGQSLSTVLTYLGDGHDIADRDYDSVVFFPPVDEIDDTDNYDLYVQGLSQVLKVVDRFDVDDINIIVDITDYVKKNKDTLLDLFEVDGETEEEIMEDLVCRVMPNVISGYTTDKVYKLLLNTINGGN